MNIRLNEVRKYIENHGEATVETLTELLGCSKMTVWRYLKQLEDEGSIRRVRNGAIATSLAGDTEGLYSQRMHENADAKLSIARCRDTLPRAQHLDIPGRRHHRYEPRAAASQPALYHSHERVQHRHRALPALQEHRLLRRRADKQLHAVPVRPSGGGVSRDDKHRYRRSRRHGLFRRGGLYRRFLYRKFPQAPCNTKGRQGHTPHRPLKAGAHPPLHLRLPV